MPALYPFRAVRPSRDKVHLVGSRSYVTYTQNDLEEKLKGNPYSFLHIIRPELDAAFHALPQPLRDFGYDMVAKYRYKVFGKVEACRVPTGDFRKR